GHGDRRCYRCSQSAPRGRGTAGPHASLFLWPAGLAVGLAPKSGATDRSVRFAPGTAFDAAPLVPPLRDGVPRRIRQVDWAAAVWPRSRLDVPGGAWAGLGWRRSTIIRRPRPFVLGRGRLFVVRAGALARTLEPMKPFVATPANRQRD